VDIHYTVDGLEHVQSLNCDCVADVGAGTDFSDWDVYTRVGGTVQLDTAVDAYVVLMKALFTDDCTIDYAELFLYGPNSFVKIWRSVYTIGETGDDTVNTYTKAAEFTFTFRTQEGGNMRLVYEETYTANDFSKSPVGLLTPAGAYDNMVQFVVGADNWILARDTSYPIQALYFLRGQNEHIFRTRWR
jgi:hypothetical protein